MDVGSKASCQEAPWNSYPYCDPNLDIESRAKDLVRRMTLVEKVISEVITSICIIGTLFRPLR